MRRNHFNRGTLLAALVPLVIAGCSDTIPPWLLDDAWGTDDPSRLSATDATDASPNRDALTEAKTDALPGDADHPPNGVDAVVIPVPDTTAPADLPVPVDGIDDPGVATHDDGLCHNPPCANEGICADSKIIITNLEGTPEFTWETEGYEPLEKTCDGLDNDCDGLTDEGLFGVDCGPPDCVPDCNGRVCGPDGCGKTCGECEPRHACTDAGTCECAPGFAGPWCDTCDVGYTGYPECHLKALQVSTGEFNTCALLEGGRVKCWGVGGLGLFPGDAGFNRMTPFDIYPGGAAVSISSYLVACVILDDRTLWCWGTDEFGQLGNGQKSNPPAVHPPERVESLNGVVSVAVGEKHVCAALETGRVMCWGTNTSGTLGFTSTSGIQATPREVPGVTGATEVTAGIDFTCALLETGGVACWGTDSQGQLGRAYATPSNSPMPVSGLNRGVVKVAAGQFFACALTESGGIKCWGANYFGQCGNGSRIYAGSPVPKDVVGIDQPAIDIAAGSTHACAVLIDGRVVCWGSNSEGQIGNEFGTPYYTTTAVEVIGLAGPAAKIACGMGHTCAILQDGRIQCWGLDDEGQLGRGHSNSSPVPVDVLGIDAAVTKVAMGRYHGCAITTAGSLKCWGESAAGKLGNGVDNEAGIARIPNMMPSDVIGIADRVADVDAGWWHTCALTDAGRLYCWGLSVQGQLGIGISGTSACSTTAQEVTSLTDVATAISTYCMSTCAVTQAGDVWCWGWDTFGTAGTAFDKNSKPVKVRGLAGITAVAGGCVRNSALAASGSAFDWGPTTTIEVAASNSPIPGLSGETTSICRTYGSTCAVMKDGQVECWGQNYAGQLGDGSYEDRFDEAAPVIGLGGSAVAVACGESHVCALLHGGYMQCWGRNDFGQLGDGSWQVRPTPVWVTGLDGAVKSIAAGSDQSCAVLEDGRVKCWGKNNSNQLGNGKDARALPPMDVSN